MDSLRLDVITIFPDYLRALDLSLIGRASGQGLIDLAVHDLRSWTHDRHRTVDDTPLGGGAGMVMRPDVWGSALDEVLGLGAWRPQDGPTAQDDAEAPWRDRPAARPGGRSRPRSGPVLVVPTPSGEVFTQRVAEDLAGADHLVFACGRYEGIDARVAAHYRARGVEVRELSIGDYVLNGGEVAALVMIEAVARLRPGVLGNPASVVEESHSADGLLEHPVLTRPVSWRGMEAPAVLLSGDHARIARYRRNRSIRQTAAARPDMIRALDTGRLDPGDRGALARCGWASPRDMTHPVELVVRPAVSDDIPALTALAARTFPDACPPTIGPEQIAAHVSNQLNADRFTVWLSDPRAVLVVAVLPTGCQAETWRAEPHEVIGYSLLLLDQADAGGNPPPGLDPRPQGVEVPPGALGEPGLAAELSKVYVDSRLRGSGVVVALLADAVAAARDRGATILWLGTHVGNRRAQKAYRLVGFRRVGERVYDVGGQVCHDVVMALSPQESDREL